MFDNNQKITSLASLLVTRSNIYGQRKFVDSQINYSLVSLKYLTIFLFSLLIILSLSILLVNSLFLLSMIATK